MGVLYARVAGAWVPISVGGANEVIRWNSAWGLVAQGTMLGSGDSMTIASNTVMARLSFKPVSGRRYKITFFGRAWQMGSGALSFNIQLMRDGAQFTVDSPWITVLANYESTTTTWLLTGNDVTSTFEVWATNVAAGGAYLYRNSSFFIIEDIGPVLGSAPGPMTLNDRANTAWGLRQRSVKGADEAGFGSTEYGISGIGHVVPADIAGRWAEVKFQLRMVPTTLPAAANSVIVVNLRSGSLTGSVLANVQFPFPLHSTPYGWDLSGTFKPTSYNTPGQQLIISTSTDGTGRYSILAGSTWSGLYDMGSGL